MTDVTGPRGAPDIGRGPVRQLPTSAAPLAERAAATDRRRRFDERYEGVLAVRSRLAARRRAAMITGAGVAAVVLAIVGQSAAGMVGALVAPVLVGAGLLWIAVARRLASRRGARAWDWQTQRYRLMGTPADEVQARDRPPPVVPR